MSEIRVQNARDAYEALNKALGDKHYATLNSAYSLALELYEADHEVEEILPYIKLAYEGLNNRQEEMDYRFFDILELYYKVLLEAGRYEEVLTICASIEEMYEKGDIFDEDAITLEEYEDAALSKAHALLALDRDEEAAELVMHLAKTSLEFSSIVNPEVQDLLISCLSILSCIPRLDLCQNLIDRALESCRLAKEEDEEDYGTEDPDTALALLYVRLAEAMFLLPSDEAEERFNSLKEELEELKDSLEDFYDVEDEDELFMKEETEERIDSLLRSIKTFEG